MNTKPTVSDAVRLAWAPRRKVVTPPKIPGEITAKRVRCPICHHSRVECVAGDNGNDLVIYRCARCIDARTSNAFEFPVRFVD